MLVNMLTTKLIVSTSDRKFERWSTVGTIPHNLVHYLPLAWSIVGRDPWLIILTHPVNNIDDKQRYIFFTSMF